jgi:N-acetyl-alpha-D-muramate 1-phosphate uridylyltransferase
MNTKQAVILAGGLGTRLKPFTEKIPKPLLEVHGRPFLVWQLEYLRDQGIERALLLISYLGEQIEDYFRKQPVAGLKIEYNSEPSPMGTGGALKHAEIKLDSRFWLFNGDTFLRLDLNQAEPLAKPNLMVCFNNPKTLGVPGNVEVKGGRALSYRDHGLAGDYDFVDAGAYLLERKLVEAEKPGTFPLSAMLQKAMSHGTVSAFASPVPFYDIGTIERLKNAPMDLFSARKDG